VKPRLKLSTHKTIENLYDKIANEEDVRVCKDISDDACQYVPINFFTLIISNIFTKLGDALSSPKTVVAWLMSFVHAPIFLIGFLVPVRESFSMLPQLFIASYIRRLPKRKWIWVLGSILQCLSILSMGVVVIMFSGVLAGWLIIILLLIFSLSRGLASISSKDVLGKTIPKTRRGILSGLSVSISGLLTLGVGFYLLTKSNEDMSPKFYGGLLIGVGLLWLLAALIYATIKEFSGETGGGGNAIREAIKSLKILKTDKAFRHFIITRALLLCSALSAPYYVVLAQEQLGNEAFLLGLFIIGNGLAASLSAVVWGRMADKSSKRVLIYAATLAASLGVIVYISANYLTLGSIKVWSYPIAFFVLGIAHSGVRLGRKTYIVDMAGGNKRTDYVAVSNSVIGLILLFTGLFGSLSPYISSDGIILLLSFFGFSGALLGTRLPDVE
jgi:hypothetical protein